MEEKAKRSTSRILDIIAAILIILAAMLTYMHHHLDFNSITEPFERLQSMASEQFTGGSTAEESEEASSTTDTTVVSSARDKVTEQTNNVLQTAEQMKDDLGITQAQMRYIKFKNFMENLEQRITELPYKPLIVLALMLFFAVKSFVGIVPVSATCLIAAVIFPFPVALLINIIGVDIIFLIKYAMGRKAKSNAFKKLIMRSDNLWRIVSDADNSTAAVLQESEEKRKSNKKARAEARLQREAELEEQGIVKKPNAFLETLKKIGKSIGAFFKKVKEALLKVPVLKIVVGDEDPEKAAEGGTGNPIVLFALRLVPFVPANPVSSLFGNMKMNLRTFLIISTIGYLLKVTSFTAIGYNIADPFSSKFIVPIIVILYISGFSVLGVNLVMKYVDKHKKDKELEPAPQEPTE